MGQDHLSAARAVARNFFARRNIDAGSNTMTSITEMDLVALMSVAVVQSTHARAPVPPAPEPKCVVHYWTNSVGEVQSFAHPTSEAAMRHWRPGVGLGAFEARYDVTADEYNARHDARIQLDPGRRGGARPSPSSNPAAAGESRSP